MSSWRGINLPTPQLHGYRNMLICHILHTFGGINIQHNNYKEKLHMHDCVLQLSDSGWRRRPNIGTIINTSVKLCIQAAFYFPFIRLHTVAPSFKSGACFLVVQIAQAAITLAITINILWDVNLGRELGERQRLKNSYLRQVWLENRMFEESKIPQRKIVEGCLNCIF